MTSQPYRRPSAHLTLTVNRHDLEWQDRAACIGHNPEGFFAEYGNAHEVHVAKRVCKGCPVRQECLEYAFRVGDEWAVLGGFTPKERAELRDGAA